MLCHSQLGSGRWAGVTLLWSRSQALLSSPAAVAIALSWLAGGRDSDCLGLLIAGAAAAAAILQRAVLGDALSAIQPAWLKQEQQQQLQGEEEEIVEGRAPEPRGRRGVSSA